MCILSCHHIKATREFSCNSVSCTVWEGLEVKKADLSVLDVAAAIIAKVDVMPESTDYLFGGNVIALIFGFFYPHILVVPFVLF